MKTQSIILIITLSLLHAASAQEVAEASLSSRAENFNTHEESNPGRILRIHLFSAPSFRESETSFITYEIYASVKNARIILYNERYQFVKSFDIDEPGSGSITIYSGTLTCGTYYYRIVADGIIGEWRHLKVIR